MRLAVLSDRLFRVGSYLSSITTPSVPVSDPQRGRTPQFNALSLDVRRNRGLQGRSFPAHVNKTLASLHSNHFICSRCPRCSLMPNPLYENEKRYKVSLLPHQDPCYYSLQHFKLTPHLHHTTIYTQTKSTMSTPNPPCHACNSPTCNVFECELITDKVFEAGFYIEKTCGMYCCKRRSDGLVEVKKHEPGPDPSDPSTDEWVDILPPYDPRNPTDYWKDFLQRP